MSKIHVAVDAFEEFTCAVEDIMTRVQEVNISERADNMTEALAEVLAEIDDRLAALEQWVDDESDDDELDDDESDDGPSTIWLDNYRAGFADGFNNWGENGYDMSQEDHDANMAVGGAYAVGYQHGLDFAASVS